MPSTKKSLQGVGGFTWLDICLFIAVITIPLNNNLNSYALILFCLAAGFKNGLANKKALLSRNFYWMLPVIYYFIVAASLLWDKNGLSALKVMEKHTAFLALPLFMVSLPAFSARVIKTALFLFVVSIAVVCIYCLAISLMHYRATGDSLVFFYHSLSENIGLNAIYLSMFVLFSILIVLFYCFIGNIPMSRFQKVAWMVLCLFFSAMIILLSSKMILFLFFVLLPATLLYIFYLHRMLLKGVLLSLLIAAAAGWLVWQLPFVKWRVQMTVFKKYESVKDNNNGMAAREIIWRSAVELIRKKPLTGYGLQNGSEQLVTKYQEHHFELGTVNKYDAHDQYLQILLNTGILGLLPFLLMLALALLKTFRERNFLLLMLTFIIMIEGLTEALLETQKGIIFFLFFLLLLYYHSPALFKRESGKVALSPA